ncbi:MAG: hypothetical protein OXC41_08125 [Gammaproteobacteria bacterium]|nr:hypothetical protein [Gammaproteobacteria bacterium]
MQTKPKPDDPEQSKRFIETAEKLGCAKTPKTFEKKFVKISKSELPKS